VETLTPFKDRRFVLAYSPVAVLTVSYRRISCSAISQGHITARAKECEAMLTLGLLRDKMATSARWHITAQSRIAGLQMKSEIFFSEIIHSKDL
jgi:hypothetical protein